jgi:hypothetical protein
MAFKPGESGNPEGRRAEDRKIKLLARQHTERAITKLAQWLDSDNPKASVAAACALLDRGYGKAQQNVSAVVEHTVNVGHAEDFADKIERTLSQRAPATVQ